ncbi:MAG TPA: CBS domain-containing protein [Bacteroidia bacterium]|jgi:signal-transduction protein with cAMP-binding, CBS, and nucleotidyltransferase domain
MLAKDLITDEIPPLKTSDTGLMAINWMDEFKVSQLPIVKGHEYLGIISDTDILDMNITDGELGNNKLSLIRPFVFESQHIYEVIKMVSNLKLSVLPVLNEHQHYVGLVPAASLIHKFAKLAATAEPGGIIVLELNTHDYSMTQIAQIVEGNDAKILSSYMSSLPDSTKVEITLKLNKEDLSAILQTFYRYNYNVKASFHQSEFSDDMKNRFDSFMNYINI